MAFLRRTLSFLFLAVLLALSGSAARVDVDGEALPGVVLVRFRAGAEPAGSGKVSMVLGKIGRAAGVTTAERAFPMLGDLAAKQGLSPKASALYRVFLVAYDAPQRPQAVARTLMRHPDVEHAEPHFVHRLQVDPNDPRFGEMGHMPILRLPEAWDVVKGESGSVVIAIVDGGTEWRHPDLEPNVWTNPGEIDGNGVDDDGNGFVDDVHGWSFRDNAADPTGAPTLPQNARHGTASAGVAAAATNNGIGIAGAGWNARFMPINASCLTEDSAICYGYQGILYAALNGADIINASWGGPSRSEFGREVIDVALENGALVVASAGNAALDVDRVPLYPANFSGVVSVGATLKTSDRVASFSNYGRSVDIFAPGGSINATTTGGNYGTLSGTSFSAPLVAGIAALIKTLRPELTPFQLMEQLRATGDDIDADNPGFGGRLGRGRANALRAVTEQSHAALRLISFDTDDEDGDGAIESGELVRLDATFINYLADATDVRLRLVSDDEAAEVVEGEAAAGTVASGESVTVTFSFRVSPTASRSRQLIFFTEATAGGATNSDVIRLIANPSTFADHHTGPLVVSITDEGNIGFLGFQGETPGSGYVYRGRSLLFEGGLLAGIGVTRLSDSVRNESGSTQNNDFGPKPGTAIEIIIPGEVTSEQGRVELTDAQAPSPLGITVIQESFADSSDAYDDFLIVRYMITNDGVNALSNLHVGLFLDWDLAADASRDLARFDGDRRFGYVMDGSSPTVLAGIKLLSTRGSMHYRAIHNPNEIYDGFTRAEKWAFMSNGVQVESLGPTDVSQLMAAGPLTIDPGATDTVAFALVAGSTEAEILAHADHAQTLWDNVVRETGTSVETPELPRETALQAIYPNPFANEVTIAFELAAPADAAIEVFDLLGRRVATLLDAHLPSGAHRVTWNAGHQPAGTFVVRLTAGGGVGHRAVVKAR